MKKLLCTLTLAFFCLLLAPQQAQAQYYCSYGVAYGASWTWQSGSSVYFYSSTQLDYCAGLYYDPATWGRYSEGNWATENVRLLAEGYTEGYADWIPAEIYYSYAYPYHRQYYNTDTRHYVLEYYQYYTCFYACGYYWYDPWGWGFAEGGGWGGPSWYGYGGAGYWSVRRRRLGDTWHTIQFISNQCQQGHQFAENGTSCPAPTPTPVPTPPASLPTVNIDKRIVVPKKGNDSWYITVNNNPSNLPITLSLTRTEGTGEAKFESTDSATMQITQTGSVVIKGVTESSKTDNIKLEAKYNGNLLNDSGGQPAVDPFSVLWVTLSFRSSGTVSPDNEAAASYTQAMGTSNLGLLYSRGAPYTTNMWRHGVEIVGTVTPSDFPYQFNLARSVIESRLYENNNPTPILPPYTRPDDTSLAQFRDDTPPRLYDLDAPGFTATAGPAGATTPVGTKKRRRTNFRQWASYHGLQVSDELLWYERLSVEKTAGEDIIANDLPNDNVVGVGSTNLGLGAPTPTPTPTPVPTRPRRSGFVSQSVPLSMEAGAWHAVSVTVRNDGDETWTDAALYRLGSQNPRDNQTWGGGRVPLPGPVAPGQQVTFSFNVIAPSTPGSYNFQWRMVQDGVEWFGDYTPNVVVDVYSFNYCYDYWAEQNCWNNGGWWDSSTCTCYGGYGGGGGYLPY